MKLLSITVGGFKNLNTTKIKLNGITALISPNNYGKSNFLEAIDFGIAFFHASRKVRKNMMSWIKGIPLCSKLENSEYEFIIEFEDEKLEQYKFVRYGFTFRWHRDDNTGCCITNEWIDARENTSVRYTSYLKRNEKKYRKGKSTSAYRNIDLDELQLAIDVLDTVEDIEFSSVIKAIQNVSFRICSSLDLRDCYQPSPVEYISDDEDCIKFDDSDVPKALCYLQNNDPERYQLFKDALFTLFPEFTNVNVYEYTIDATKSNQEVRIATVTNKDITEKEIEEKIPFKLREHIYRFFVKCEYMNQPISMEYMSTGTKRAIWLLTNAFIAQNIGIKIVGIEEIETSIHIKLMKTLLETITEALEDTTLLISSHSPYLIQYLKPEKIYIGVPNNDGIAEFRRIQEKKMKYIIENAREIGLSVGEYLFELLSGDSESYEILESFLEVRNS